jgi:uncharacterized NAD(P)/FAD-binding protein YdhS
MAPVDDPETAAPRSTAIVGAGFCGALLAVHLVRAGRGPVLLIDRGGRFGPGLAYGRARPWHLLNTPAGRMSAFADDPDHFTRWARARDPEASGGSYLPRPDYGAYLEELLAAADPPSCPPGQLEATPPGLAPTCPPGQLDRATPPGLAPTCPPGQLTCPPGQPTPGGALTRLHADVVDLVRGDGLTLVLADGRRLRADRVVLAPGNAPPAAPAAVPAALRGDPRHVADPWRFDPTTLDPDAPVLLLGTGLTAVDLVISLAEAGHRGPIHAVSRHGLLPQPHRPSAGPPAHAAPAAHTWPATARGYLRGLRGEVRRAAAAGVDWREVVAALRPVTQALWRRLPLVEQDRFLRHLRAYWDSHRHRAAPASHRVVADLLARGRLHVHAAALREVAPTPAGLRVALAPRRAGPRTLEVAVLVNCTGPAQDPRAAGDPLLTALLARGLARVDGLGLGLDIADDGALLAADGRPAADLFAAGALRRPQLWESTAVLELAAQVAALAARLS